MTSISNREWGSDFCMTVLARGSPLPRLAVAVTAILTALRSSRAPDDAPGGVSSALLASQPPLGPFGRSTDTTGLPTLFEAVGRCFGLNGLPSTHAMTISASTTSGVRTVWVLVAALYVDSTTAIGMCLTLGHDALVTVVRV